MTDLVRINSDNGVGLPVTLADGSRYIIPAVVQITPTGALVATGGNGANTELDTNGDIVPTYKGHSYTYDDSGNLSTDTVDDGPGNRWVKTYTYTPSGPATDSGWVKQ